MTIQLSSDVFNLSDLCDPSSGIQIFYNFGNASYLSVKALE